MKLSTYQSHNQQRAKKVVSDFATGLAKSVFNLPNMQVMFFEEFE